MVLLSLIIENQKYCRFKRQLHKCMSRGLSVINVLYTRVDRASIKIYLRNIHFFIREQLM